MHKELSKAEILFSEGKFKLALNYFKRVDLKRESDYSLSLYFYKVAFCFFELSSFSESLLNAHKSLRHLRKLSNSESCKLKVDVYRLLSSIFYKTGEYRHSLDSILKAEQILISGNCKSILDQSKVYNTLANIYSMLQDFTKSIDYRFQSIRLIEENYPREFKILGIYYNNLAVSIEKINHRFDYKLEGNIYAKYINYYKKALFFLNRFNTATESGIVANIYNNIAFHFLKKGNFSKSIYYLRKSLDKLNKIKEDNSYLLSHLYLNYGYHFYKTKKYQKAINYFQKSLDIRIAILGPRNIHLVKNYQLFADYYFKIEEFENAISCCDKAVKILNGDNSDTSSVVQINVNGTVFLPEILEVLHKKGKALINLYLRSTRSEFLKEATVCFRIISQVADKIRSSLSDEESKSILLSKSNMIFQDAIYASRILYTLTFDNTYLEDSFNYSEKSKGMILLESVNEVNAKELLRINPGLLSDESNYKNEINLYSRLIFHETNGKKKYDNLKINNYKSEVFKNKRLLDSTLSKIKKNYPDYYNLKYNYQTAKINEIQSHLRKNDTLIEYFTSEENIFIFIITKDDASIQRVPKSKNFDRKLKQFRKCLSLSDSDTIKNDFQKFSTLSHYFYKLLVKDCIPEDTDNLIIIPDGLLNYIPFEVLITEKSKTGNFKNVSYLLEKYNISYSYSATLLLRNLSKSKSKSVPKPKILGFAPSFNKESKAKVKADVLRSGLNSLKWNSAELKTAKKYFGGRIFLDEKAGKKQFVKYSADYPVLHLATHGIVEDKNPMFSKIAFAPVKDNVDDGYLHTYELYGMKLNSDLTILSACDTGYGKLIKGEGVMSIARGFLYAGSKSIMMSLWQVSDSATCKIIGYFYRYLSKGMSKNEALRKAKLDYIKNSDSIKANPAYWAPFVLIGNTNPL